MQEDQKENNDFLESDEEKHEIEVTEEQKKDIAQDFE